jgi:hypothetical protein
LEWGAEWGAEWAGGVGGRSGRAEVMLREVLL